MFRKTHAAILLAIVMAVAVALLPHDLSGAQRWALIVTLVAAVFWTLEPIPLELTAIGVLLSLAASGAVPFERAFSAFSGKAVWLVFSGMVLSLLITETGLGARLTRLLAPGLGRPHRLVAALHLLGLLAAVLVPSGVVRVLILMPVLCALLDAAGEKPGSRVSAAIVLSAICSTYYGGTGILTASVPNLVVMGVVEGRGTPIYWGQWAFYVWPVIALLRVAFLYLLVRLVFRPGGFTLPPAGPAAAPAPLSSRERRAGLILLLGVLLWASDVLHGVHPAYVGLGLVFVSLLPCWGPLHIESLKRANFPILIYIGAAFALGEALQVTGLGGRLAARLPAILPGIDVSVAARLAAVSASVVPFNFVADTAVVAGALTPIFLDSAGALGLTPLQIGLSVAVGTGMVFLPYQGAPFMVAYSFRRVRMGQFALIMVLTCLANLLVLLPVNLFYWKLVGLY